MIEVMHHRMGGDGSTHANNFLPEYIASEAKQMKKILQLPDDAPYFYCEDHAPGHYHDLLGPTAGKPANQRTSDQATTSVWLAGISPKDYKYMCMYLVSTF